MSVETVSERVQLAIAEAAAMPLEGVLSALGTSVRGLDEAEAARRLAQGANVLEARRVSWFHVLVRQFASPLQALLVASQFWYLDKGGTLVMLYLPLAIAMMFRPTILARRQTMPTVLRGSSRNPATPLA